MSIPHVSDDDRHYDPGGIDMDTGLVAVLRRLLALAERDPDRACAQFDVLVACYGRPAAEQALWEVAGPELADLGFAA